MSVVREHKQRARPVGLTATDRATRAPAPSDDFARALVMGISIAILLASLYLSPALRLPHATAEMLIGGLPVIGAVVSYGKLAGRTRSPGPLALGAAYGAAVVVTSILNLGTDTSFLMVASPVASAVVMTFVGGLLTRRELLAIGRVLVLVGALQALIAMMEVQARAPWAISLAATADVGYVVRSNLVLDGFLRASGSMGHPILLGVACSVALLFVLARGAVRHAGLRMLLVALLGWGIALSGSRSSLAALGFAVVIYFAHRHSPTRRGLRTLILLALIPLTWLYVSSTIDEAREVSPFSLTNRLSGWGRFLETMSRPGAGAIFGQGRDFALETVADNQFLTTAGRFGIVGLILLVPAVAYALSSRSPLLSAVSASVLFMFLSFDAMSFSFTSSMFWLLVGASRAAVEMRAPGLDAQVLGRAAGRHGGSRRRGLQHRRPVAV
ncbi:O-antigen ligase family protein [Cellulomonas aerilata]|uniref:O-antigen ligase-related domain-containing protein n=1 Tax=Cellulomonas aerilata TaxID=515326 RepID=A0A512DDH8_9CELL|nr:O-antigen ligase family protein [Cellulomonas aerilata]GEO34515.1 hypothetical protein CAE01nite_22400 [Cellulomonas aerilata]